MILLHQNTLDTRCAALAYAMNITSPEYAASPTEELIHLVDTAFGVKRADRLFMYNPDAIATWIIEKYSDFFDAVRATTTLELPFCTVMPSVTPVCFGTMYTGAQPAVHGITRYAKPVIKIDTLFDAMIRAGKACTIIADRECSMGKIYLEREMDYYYFDTCAEINAKVAQLILEDRYDFIAVYNGNYDSTMHKNGPEAPISLGKLSANTEAFATFAALIRDHRSMHNTLIGFAMDHGCHEIDGNCGSHGLDMPEDLNITHFYGAYAAKDTSHV